MASKHTPGPWRVGGGYTHNFGFDCLMVESGPADPDEAIAIASVWSDGDDGSDTESEANAALVSAAPDLLAALEESIEYSPYKGESEETPFLRRARAAIAKAKGEA